MEGVLVAPLFYLVVVSIFQCTCVPHLNKSKIVKYILIPKYYYVFFYLFFPVNTLVVSAKNKCTTTYSIIVHLACIEKNYIGYSCFLMCEVPAPDKWYMVKYMGCLFREEIFRWKSYTYAPVVMPIKQILLNLNKIKS